MLLLSGDSDPDLDPGSTVSPSSDPLADALISVLSVLELLPKLCHGGRNETAAPNKRHRSGFDSGASITASSELEGINAGGVARFGIHKWSRFGAALTPGWEAGTLLLF